jgi:hypothetical protein
VDFPHEFSAQARAHIEAGRLKASRELGDAQAQKPPDAWKRGAREWDRQEFHNYILRVFLAFAREACELGKVGIWTVDRVRSEVDEFLRRFTIEAYYEKGCDRFGEKFPKMTGDWGGGLLLDVEQLFHRADEWRQFEDELLAVAEQVAGSTHGSDRTTSQLATESSTEPVPPRNGTDVAVSDWASDLETTEGRKTAREGWKQHWTIPDRECTNDDLTETAFNQKDRPFLNQWENRTVRLKDPSRSSRVQAIERVLRENIPPRWHPAAKQSRG